VRTREDGNKKQDKRRNSSWGRGTDEGQKVMWGGGEETQEWQEGTRQLTDDGNRNRNRNRNHKNVTVPQSWPTLCSDCCSADWLFPSSSSLWWYHPVGIQQLISEWADWIIQCGVCTGAVLHDMTETKQANCSYFNLNTNISLGI
jgi:hypothetical protein